jgi:hypothetical protein
VDATKLSGFQFDRNPALLLGINSPQTLATAHIGQQSA